MRPGKRQEENPVALVLGNSGHRAINKARHKPGRAKESF